MTDFLSKLIRSAAIAAIFSTSTPVTAQQKVTVDANIFERAIARKIDGKVKGYAFVIANRTGIVAEASGGWAQGPGDGQLPMSTTIPAGWGSNQKVLSGIALLDLLERLPGSLNDMLDLPMRNLLPSRWNSAYFDKPFRQGLSLITLRDLLDHTSGLPEEKSGGAHGTRIARALSEGSNNIARALNDRNYRNHNYTLMLYIIPRLAFPKEARRIEQSASRLGLRDYNRRVALEFGKLYTRYMQQVFLPKVSPRVRGTCRPGNLASKRYAKAYATKLTGKGRTDSADGFCRSQGGWFYSARDMAHIHRAMEFRNTFVDASTRKLFRVGGSKRRMIYWRTFDQTILRLEAGQKFRGHGGLTRFKSTSVTMRLPFGYVGVGIANSGDLSIPDLARVMLDAFYEASRQKYEQGKDRPGANIANFMTLVPDPKICAQACENRSNCEAWSYVMPGIQHPIGAKCWLKSGNPPPAPRNNPTAVSGVKGASYNRDRPGADLMRRQIQRNDPALCRFICQREADCKSWTFVPQGFQGPNALCWIKNGVPRARAVDGLVSGLAP